MELKGLVPLLLYHSKSIWLFTASDIKTIIVPSLLFGTANASVASKYNLQEGISSSDSTGLVLRSIQTVLWVWMQLFPFTISNQKSPESIKEDQLNKPWRTLPSGRMTVDQAERTMYAFYGVALCYSSWVGGLRQSVALILLGSVYNHFGGGDNSWIVRNLINALGYCSFISGALEVQLGYFLPISMVLVQWLSVTAAIIFTTVHTQDLYDLEGDRARDRKTMPLVVGEVLCRRITAVWMIFWGFACPLYWQAPPLITVFNLLLTSTVAYRTLNLLSVKADRLTFKIWTVWTGFVFVLPTLC